jgi:hypothetical protein
LQTLIERLNQAPDKNKLAFLDLLGINLLPPQPARAPLVFQAMDNMVDMRVPARTRAGAKVAGQSDPLVFETEEAIALAGAQLVEVVTLHPGRDAYADHSTAIARGQPFTLFTPLQPVPHTLYLAHDLYCALIGKSSLEVQFDLALPSSQPLPIAWEYWDGQIWRGFKEFQELDKAGESFDGTAGLTRTGTIRLVNECSEAVKTKVQGISTYWVRGRLTAPLPPQPSAVLAVVDRIRLRTVVERPLQYPWIGTPGPTGPIQPDEAFADGTKLDLSKTFLPLGRNPDGKSTFYFASEEVFSRAGAEVTLGFRRVSTPEEEGDAKEAAALKEKADALEQQARDLISSAARRAAELVIAAGEGVLPYAQALNNTTLVNDKQAVENARDTDPLKLETLDTAAHILMADIINLDVKTFLPTMFSNAANEIIDQFNPGVQWNMLVQLSTAVVHALGQIIVDVKDILDSLNKLNILVTTNNHSHVQETAQSLAQAAITAAQVMLPYFQVVANSASADKLQDVKNATKNDPIDIDHLAGALGALVTSFKSSDVETWLSVTFNLALGDVQVGKLDLLLDLQPLGVTANTELAQAALYAASALDPLRDLAGLPGAGTTGPPPPTLDHAQLVWEYWNDEHWAALAVAGPDAPGNFLSSGEISLVVPKDLAPTSVNNVTARWLRVRLASGSYNRLRLVTWSDPQSQTTNIMPILEPRPPALDSFFLGYTYRSPKAPPEHCLAYNDFQYEDRTQAARGTGMPFTPYRPVDDRTPALYLGFDRPLPADLIGLYVTVQEVEGRTRGPALHWEYWNGMAWLALSVRDETHNLALPGMVQAIWPGVPVTPPVSVVQAGGTRVTVIDPRQAARFSPGDLLYIAQDGQGELATLVSVAGTTLALKAPLSRDYARATIGLAGLPRFGTPRTWIRARLQNDVEPLGSKVNGLYLNAVWAAQIQTIENEMLGSSDEQPNQVFFLRSTPVLEGEVIEVRELAGPRVPAEWPLLHQELLGQGLGEDDIRTVTDRRSGKISEVWVRWRERPNLFFSGPTDRHYVIERSRGRLIFGDNVYGRVPPAGADGIRATRYRSGGGSSGNVAAGAISQVLSGVLVQNLTNPRAAEGGAEGEPVAAVLGRGPQTMRHRHQALSWADYEALAREASPAVAVARALPTTHPSGRPAPGWVKVLIVPQSQDPQPQPSFELRRRVQDYLAARAPAAVAGQIVVGGPQYLPIGVAAIVAPVNAQEAGPVGERARQALADFLHPLTGGPRGAGWPFGRNVYLSDVATVLEALAGVDYVTALDLLLDGTPRGEMIAVPPDRIVVAGPLRVVLAGSEE